MSGQTPPQANKQSAPDYAEPSTPISQQPSVSAPPMRHKTAFGIMAIMPISA
jgi:hypothetical protein